MIKLVKLFSFFVFFLGLSVFFFAPVYSSPPSDHVQENSIKNGQSPVEQRSKTFNPDTYSGDIVTVTNDKTKSDHKNTLSDYLEETSVKRYYCYGGQVTLTEKTTFSANERKNISIEITLNNENMKAYIPSKLQHRIQQFRGLEYSFSCEKDAVWVLANGYPAQSNEYVPPIFAFSFFAVPESRNLQKFKIK